MEKIKLLKSQQLLMIKKMETIGQVKAVYEKELKDLGDLILMISREAGASSDYDWRFSDDGQYLEPVDSKIKKVNF